ncbi:MAG TPA: DNA polymerase III subunit gamma/tau, partial [Chloroflexota bacterium]|nr:DNA polymerase III subunit gamma/tau [Chloroflexota bacterium]
MVSITLYNKWRPQTFADPQRHPLVGQEHVTRTLRNAVARNQIAHAYLFCGPRGTGKTSAARILARAVNCRRGMQGEPCNECENCRALLSGRQLDLLIEIDGASNRGVDDVRQLRERLLQRPGGADLTGRFKVYIIDEVHMLTQEAFIALLKSLEEPPAHVVFVLATTDPQKVPATVASRCQRFDFKPISLETLVAHLGAVASAEGVRLDPAAAEVLARAAAGGARDAISLLDQAFAFAGAAGEARSAGEGPGAPPPGGPGPLPIGAPTISAAQVQAMLGLTSFEAVCRLVDSIVEGDLPAGLRLVHEVASQGIDLRQFTRQVLELLRALLLAESDAAGLLHLDDERQEAVRQRARRLTLPDLVRLIKLFTLAEQGLKAPSAQPQLPLELAIVEASLAPAPAPAAQPLSTPAPAIPPPPPARLTASAAPPPAVAEGSPPTWPAPAPAVDGPPAPPAAQPSAERAPEPGPAASVPPDPAAGEPPAPPAPAPEVEAEPLPPATPPVPRAAPSGAAALTFEQVQQRWPAVMEAVRQSSKSVEALLRGGKPSAVEEPNVVVLEFLYDFHRKKIL